MKFVESTLAFTISAILASMNAYAVDTSDIESITMRIIGDDHRSDQAVRELVLPAKATSKAVNQAQSREDSGLSRANDMRSRRTDNPDDLRVERLDDIKQRAADAKSTGLSRADEAKQRAEDARANVRARAEEAKQRSEDARSAAQSQADDAKQRAEQTKEVGQDRAEDAKKRADDAKERGQNIKSDAATQADETRAAADAAIQQGISNANDVAAQKKQDAIDKSAAARDTHQPANK